MRYHNKKPYGVKFKDLFEAVEGGEDDVMASSHQTHGRQQLQHQRLRPEEHGVHLPSIVVGVYNIYIQSNQVDALCEGV